MFMFKKVASHFLFPMPIGLGLAILGLLLLWFTRRQKAGKVLVTLGVALVLVLSYGAVSCQLLAPLETQYPSYDRAYLDDSGSAPAPAYIVVLGGGQNTDPRLPLTSQLSDATLTRVVEGIRLQRLYPESILILAGGTVFDPAPEAVNMARLARELGVDEADLVIEAESRDTEDQARQIAALVGDAPFALVTSAAHMPRAMALCAAEGLAPYPAPTDYWVKAGASNDPGRFFPSAHDFVKAEHAWYEYLGLAWSWLRGRL
jgi:uncharacterized SAM-binding protein YcdF (DUF218 family)